jgi:hypothetical protein
MKVQKHNNYDVLPGFLGFPEGYSNVGEQVKRSASRKSPMLVTGGKTFILQNINNQIDTEYEVYMFFYPTEKEVWKTGVLALSKIDPTVYYSIWSEDLNIKRSFEKCFQTLKETVKSFPAKKEISKNELKLATWISRWLERLPKYSLTYLLHLENYENVKRSNSTTGI